MSNNNCFSELDNILTLSSQTRDKIAKIMTKLKDENYNKGMLDALKEVLPKINELKNPYPNDIFTGTTAEGKSGVVLNKVYEAFREDFRKIINELIEEGEKQ
jgi:hypothetical protein